MLFCSEPGEIPTRNGVLAGRRKPRSQYSIALIEESDRKQDLTLQFECDRKKAELNLRKHEVSFEEAVTVFYDPLSATFDDPDNSAGEYRYISIDFSCRGHLLVVAHTERREILRIISARLATAHERKRHEDQK
jgi:uncharacterized DUF497 family protein